MNRLLILAASVLISAAGCTFAGSGSSPTVPSTPPGSPSAGGFVLRTSVRQAIPPAAAFMHLNPPLLIENRTALVQAPQDAMAPPRLVTHLQQHAISEAGIDRIIAAAEAAGLLSGTTDFAPDRPPGSATGEIVLVIDGVEHRLTGDPDRRIVCVTTPCEAQPGTAEAFGGFWSKLEDLNGLVGDDLGPAELYEPERLGLLLLEPGIDATEPPTYAAWPVAGVAIREFGVLLPGAQPDRCGIVDGAQVHDVIAALREGNVYTHWRDEAGGERAIVSRPLFPGEPDPCQGQAAGEPSARTP